MGCYNLIVTILCYNFSFLSTKKIIFIKKVEAEVKVKVEKKG